MLLEAFTEEFSGLEKVCLAIRSTGLKDELDNIHNPRHARIIKVEKVPTKGNHSTCHLLSSFHYLHGRRKGCIALMK